jgi:two-component system, NtrC family, sensor histidine kinase HydH
MKALKPDAVMSMTKLTNSEPGHEGLSFANALRDCLVCGVVCLSPNLQNASLNREAAHLLGLDTTDATTLSPAAALPEPLLALAREVLAAGRPTAERELELPSRNGAPLALRVNALLVPAADPPAGVVLVLNNLTPARQFEPHLAQLDRLANAGTLAASMAHEIKNALVAGKTFIDLLLEQKQDGELVEIVRRELDRIDTIVTRMLKFAGSARPAFGPVGVHELLDHSLRLVQHRAEMNYLTVNRSFTAAPDTVQGDDYELQQAFVNLLLNALDAMGSNGTLTVATERLSPEAAAASLPTAQPRPYLRVTIQDTGVGIPAESLARLFDPFFTTKPTGTGLGLSITRRIIQAHRGAITVESQPGQGTTFRILLPTP